MKYYSQAQPFASFTFQASQIRPQTDKVIFQVSGDSAAFVAPSTVYLPQTTYRMYSTTLCYYCTALCWICFSFVCFCGCYCRIPFFCTLMLTQITLGQFTIPSYLSSTASSPYLAAQFIADIASPQILVTVTDTPVGPVSLRPTAPNTVFTPDVLNFDVNTLSVVFTVTTLDGTGSSASANSGTPKVMFCFSIIINNLCLTQNFVIISLYEDNNMVS